MDNFTIGYLASQAGLTAVTFLLVQFFKEPIKAYLSDWWVRLLAVIFALGIQAFTLFVSNNFTVETIGLAVLNSFFIAITASGTYSLSKTGTTTTDTTSLVKIPEIDSTQLSIKKITSTEMPL